MQNCIDHCKCVKATDTVPRYTSDKNNNLYDWPGDDLDSEDSFDYDPAAIELISTDALSFKEEDEKESERHDDNF